MKKDRMRACAPDVMKDLMHHGAASLSHQTVSLAARLDVTMLAGNRFGPR
jgi:hypothetical protein